METNPTAKIVVATHKRYEMPDNGLYLPLQVGAEGKESLGYTKDNTGENISEKNASFCELTGLYWAWKNLHEDYIGLAHYRRHFGRRERKPLAGVLTDEQLKPMLGKYKVFVPKKRIYGIETLYSHYAHTHYAGQLDCTREIIAEKYPDYIESYDAVVNQRWGYMFNMMIMRCDLLDSYCQWLFDILFELEKRMPPSEELSKFQGRFYGRVSEIIFNVWLNYQIKNGTLSKKDIKELHFFYTEKINWIRKGTAFLQAKLFHKRYEGSF